MRIFLLGATGSIGLALLPVLVARGHDVVALARSGTAAEKIERAGATPLRGNIVTPENFIPALPGSPRPELHREQHRVPDRHQPQGDAKDQQQFSLA